MKYDTFVICLHLVVNNLRILEFHHFLFGWGWGEGRGIIFLFYVDKSFKY